MSDHHKLPVCVKHRPCLYSCVDTCYKATQAPTLRETVRQAHKRAWEDSPGEAIRMNELADSALLATLEALIAEQWKLLAESDDASADTAKEIIRAAHRLTAHRDALLKGGK